MKKRFVILFSVLFLAVVLTLLGGSRLAQAQGLVEYAVLQVEGTLGQNGIYISDVSYDWILPETAIPESIVGCEPGAITQDTPPEGVYLLCYGDYAGGVFIGVIVDENNNLQPPIIHVNLAPTIDRWIVPATVHFNGEVQISAAVSDPGGDPLSAVVHWGDGLIEPVVVQADGSLQAAHTYATAGDFEVRLQVEDGEGGLTEERGIVNVEDPIQSIESRLIPGALALVPQGILNEGQADSLVVKLQGAVDALNDDRPAAPQKLDAYLNEYVAVVPNGFTAPDFLVATDIRDGLVLHGWVPLPK